MERTLKIKRFYLKKIIKLISIDRDHKLIIHRLLIQKTYIFLYILKET